LNFHFVVADRDGFDSVADFPPFFHFVIVGTAVGNMADLDLDDFWDLIVVVVFNSASLPLLDETEAFDGIIDALMAENERLIPFFRLALLACSFAEPICRLSREFAGDMLASDMLASDMLASDILASDMLAS
jgi:hypothetical protein